MVPDMVVEEWFSTTAVDSIESSAHAGFWDSKSFYRSRTIPKTWTLVGQSDWCHICLMKPAMRREVTTLLE
jgi:hypothetical protein